jgi:hypothetical protein
MMNRFINRAEIIWEKGTNRSSFFRGEVDKYGWVDTGKFIFTLRNYCGFFMGTAGEFR